MNEIIKKRLESMKKHGVLHQHISNEFAEKIPPMNCKKPVAVKQKFIETQETQFCSWCKKSCASLTLTRFLGALCGKCLEQYKKKEI